MRTMSFASKKAEDHFRQSIEVAKEIGAKHAWGQATLGLGLLYQKKRRTDEAQKYLSQAIALFEECEAGTYLKRAKEVLASLGWLSCWNRCFFPILRPNRYFFLGAPYRHLKSRIQWLCLWV